MKSAGCGRAAGRRCGAGGGGRDRAAGQLARRETGSAARPGAGTSWPPDTGRGLSLSRPAGAAKDLSAANPVVRRFAALYRRTRKLTALQPNKPRSSDKSQVSTADATNSPLASHEQHT